MEIEIIVVDKETIIRCREWEKNTKFEGIDINAMYPVVDKNE